MSAVFSCREAARLLSESLDHPLPLPRRLELRVHLVLCGACRVHRRQIRTLERLVSDYAQRVPTDGPGMDEPRRARIQAALERLTRDA